VKRRFLRRFLKPAMLAFAVSLILVPSATAMPTLSVEGSGTAGVTTSSPGRISPDLPPVSAAVPVAGESSGFDWSNAVLGAAGVLFLTTVLATIALFAVRRRSVPLAHR
jgi:hypothetical protein